MPLRLVERLKLFGCAVLLLGLAALLVLREHSDSHVYFQLAVSGAAAQADVVATESFGFGRGKQEYPIFRFSLPDGQAITAKSFASIWLTPKRKLRPVDVVYLPSNPKVVAPEKFVLFWAWIKIWAFMIFFIFFVVTGALALWKALASPWR